MHGQAQSSQLRVISILYHTVALHSIATGMRICNDHVRCPHTCIAPLEIWSSGLRANMLHVCKVAAALSTGQLLDCMYKTLCLSWVLYQWRPCLWTGLPKPRGLLCATIASIDEPGPAIDCMLVSAEVLLARLLTR